jgi:hypothetical protein
MVLTTYLQVTASPKLTLLPESPLSSCFLGCKISPKYREKEEEEGNILLQYSHFSGKKSTNFDNNSFWKLFCYIWTLILI